MREVAEGVARRNLDSHHTTNILVIFPMAILSIAWMLFLNASQIFPLFTSPLAFKHPLESILDFIYRVRQSN